LELAPRSPPSHGGHLGGARRNSTRVDDTIPTPRYAKLLDAGYHAVQTVAVPVNAASIRLAVRDARSNRVGSLEVRNPDTHLAAEPDSMELRPIHSARSGTSQPAPWRCEAALLAK
jgi:hypothetical protein